MSFLNKILGKKDTPVESYSEFWNWFLEHEKEFFKIVQSGQNIPAGFFDKLAPKLAEIHSEIYFLAGMMDDQTAELVLTPDGAIRNIYVIEELVSAAPKMEGWKFTALKPAVDIKNVGIRFDNLELNAENLKFYPTIHKDYPDEIDLTIVYDDFVEDKKEFITNGVYIFLDNYLGELHSVTLIDNMQVTGNSEVDEELIPIEKLKDYLIWREKEFVEKYEGIRYDTENDGYSNFEAKSEDGRVLLAIINTTILKWDKKASHPWVFILSIPFKSDDGSGLPNKETYKILNDIEDEIMLVLKDSEGYLNIGRETANNKREIFFACKDFREPSKTADAIIKKYSKSFEISYEIYKDKYWQSFRHFQQS